MKRTILILLLVVCCSCSKSEKENSTVCVINDSQEQLASGHLKICGDTFITDNITPADLVCFNFKACSDTHYSMEFRLLSGKVFSKSIGYITTGFIYNDKVVIGKEDVTLEPSAKLDTHYNAHAESEFKVFLIGFSLFFLFVLPMGFYFLRKKILRLRKNN